MTVTDVKVRKVFNDEGPMKAIVSVTFDDQLAVHDIKVIEGNKDDDVSYRYLFVNDPFIRGFGLPDYSHYAQI